jgi:hypothetical protein
MFILEIYTCNVLEFDRYRNTTLASTCYLDIQAYSTSKSFTNYILIAFILLFSDPLFFSAVKKYNMQDHV